VAQVNPDDQAIGLYFKPRCSAPQAVHRFQPAVVNVKIHAHDQQVENVTVPTLYDKHTTALGNSPEVLRCVGRMALA
jgi:hypothetical protein